MATKQRTYRVCDFKRWLKGRTYEVFGSDTCDCPLAKWTGEEVSLDRLDRMPGWCNRFVGSWDEAVSMGTNPLGHEALTMLEAGGITS